MRRKDREVTALSEMDGILALCKTCCVAMIDGDMPYVLPLSYGYELAGGKLTLYFHSAKTGRKLDILRRNNRVCFAICREGEPIFAAQNPCNSGYYYASVQGVGEARFLDDPAEKCRALTRIMERQTGATIAFTEAQADTVCIFKIDSTEFTGKRKPRPAAD